MELPLHAPPGITQIAENLPINALPF